MAVPKITETRCYSRDRAYKHCTTKPHPYIYLSCTMYFPVISEHNQRKMTCTKKDVGDGVICAVFVCPVSTPSFCGLWHCHPYIPLHFWRMFYIFIKDVGLGLQVWSMPCFAYAIPRFKQIFVHFWKNAFYTCMREMVDSLCRDGADMPIVCTHRKTFSTCKHLHSKPFWAPSCPIPPFLYPTITPQVCTLCT